MSLTSRILGRYWRLPPARTHRLTIERGLSIPMRDGVTLLADRYYPRGGERLPVVLIRSPYGRSDLFELVSTLLSERGLQVLLESCRGTGGSGGVLYPFFAEEHDGCDTIAWLEQQPWFCGKLSAMGASYLGSAAWAAAHGAREKLAAVVVSNTLSDARAETFAFGGFTLESCLEWTRTMMHPEGFSTRANILESLFPRLQDSMKLEQGHATLPLRDADHVTFGKQIPWWQDWMEHAEPGDPFWNPIDYTAAVTRTLPAAMVGGWYDIFLPWLVKDFEAAHAAGRKVTLTLGPWKHTSLGSVGATLADSLPLLHTEMNGAPEVARPAVRLFVVGANQWREYESWPPERTRPMSLFLAPGKLESSAPVQSEPSTYRYDPADPTPSVHGPTIGTRPAVGDMARLERRSDVLLFTGAPLDADTDIAGVVHADLHFRSSCAHVDFYVCLCDVDARGLSTNVCDGYIRLRHIGLSQSQSEKGIDGVHSVRIEFWPIAYRFRSGHRMRVIVASGAHPRYSRNHGTGEPLGDAVHFQSSEQEIFHDDAHPSRVVVPVCV